MAKGGLFAVMGPPPDEEEDSLEDYADDLGEPESDEELEPLAAGPFDAYAETIFDAEADPAARSDALRQAILTVLEENGKI